MAAPWGFDVVPRCGPLHARRPPSPASRPWRPRGGDGGDRTWQQPRGGPQGPELDSRQKRHLPVFTHRYRDRTLRHAVGCEDLQIQREWCGLKKTRGFELFGVPFVASVNQRAQGSSPWRCIPAPNRTTPRSVVRPFVFQGVLPSGPCHRVGAIFALLRVRVCRCSRAAACEKLHVPI